MASPLSSVLHTQIAAGTKAKIKVEGPSCCYWFMVRFSDLDCSQIRFSARGDQVLKPFANFPVSKLSIFLRDGLCLLESEAGVSCTKIWKRYTICLPEYGCGVAEVRHWAWSPDAGREGQNLQRGSQRYLQR